MNIDKMIEDKYIFLGCNLYKFTLPNQSHVLKAISLVNVMTGEFARHCNGIIIDSSYEENELFLYDSSFIVEINSNLVTLYCSNPGLETHCIVMCDNVLRIIEKHRINTTESLLAFQVLKNEEIFVKDSLPVQNLDERKVVAFGSSSTEIFDYIFGDNPNYLPFWASGWSARGLRKIDEQMAPYLDTLNKISKESIILLHFGSVDTDFNLPYKMANSGFYDIPSFIKEMIDGVISMKKFLNNLGFNNVYAVFTAPPIILSKEYWQSFFNLDQVSACFRGNVLWEYSIMLSTLLPVINCLPELFESTNNPVCSAQFSRDYPDHHVDFISVQDVVYNKLKNIKGMLPRKFEPHKNLYYHMICDVSFVRKNNKPRARTCR